MLDKTTSTASYVASGIITTGGWFSAHDWPIYVGVVLGISTFLINIYFKFRNDRRELAAQEKAAEDRRKMLVLFESAIAKDETLIARKIYEESPD